MARAMARLQAWSLEAGALDIMPGATLTLFEEGTASTTRTPLSVPIYAAVTGGTALSTVLTADATGQRTIYADTPCRFDVEVSGTGITTYRYPHETFSPDPRDLIYYVRLYGILGDGTTDNAALLQDLIETVHDAGGGLLRFERGVYRLSTTLDLYGGVTLEGVGHETVLSFDDPEDADTGTFGTTCISIAEDWTDYGNATDPGYAGEHPSLSLHATTTINAGDRAVRLATPADAANLAAGDLVQLYSADDTYYPIDEAGSQNTPTGILTTRVVELIESGGNTYVALEDGSPYTYTQPDALPRLRYRVRATEPSGRRSADRGGIRNLTIAAGDGEGNEVIPRNRSHGIVIDGAEDVVIDHVRVIKMRYRGVKISNARDCHVTDCMFDQIVSSRTGADGGGDGAAIEVFYSLGCHFTGNRVTRAGWAFAANGSQYLHVRDTVMTGRSGVYQTLALAVDPATNPALDRTTTADPNYANTSDGGWTYVGRGMKLQLACTGCVIEGNTLTDVTLTGILLVNSPWNTVRGNSVLNTGVDIIEVGIEIATAAPGLSVGNDLSDNLIRNAASHSINVGAAETSVMHTRISGNRIEGGPFAAIRVANASGNQICNNILSGVVDGIVLTAGVTEEAADNVVSGNTIDASDVAIDDSAANAANLISDNKILDGTTSIAAVSQQHRSDTLSEDAVAVTVAAWTEVTRVSNATAHAVTHTNHGGTVIISWSGGVTTAATRGLLGISMDGGAPGTTLANVPASSTVAPVSFSFPLVAGAGTHTFRLMAFASTGGQAVTVSGSQCLGVLQVQEVRA